jgi:hypothetical protein
LKKWDKELAAAKFNKGENMSDIDYLDLRGLQEKNLLSSSLSSGDSDLSTLDSSSPETPTPQLGDLKAELQKVADEWATLDPEETYIFYRILELLMTMTKTMQNLAVAQSSRMQYLTAFQNTYTTLQMQVPFFTQDGKTPLGQADDLGNNDTSNSNARNDANSRMGLVLDNLRNERGVKENQSKQLQTFLNTTSDAVNQGLSYFSDLLQQGRELGSIIFR